jgi:ParB family chromosome partitioning protein
MMRKTMTKSVGLGRNLSILLSQKNSSSRSLETDVPMRLDIQMLKPGKYQPRQEMDESALKELAGSIKNQGLLQPIVVRKIDDKYEIIAGERRWRACQMVGMVDVPVVVKQVDDETAMAMGLVENLQREDLNPMDQARAMYRLTTEFGLTHQQVSEIVAKSRASVSNFMRLLQLTLPVRSMLENGDLDMGHARALLSLDENNQIHVAQLVISKNLSVRETENLVNRIIAGKPLLSKKAEVTVNLEVKEKINLLAQQLQTPIKVKSRKNGAGTLIIQYKNNQILEKMLKRLMNETD